MLPLHLGALHAYEWVLLMILAFGPFVALAFVVWHQRRRTGRDEGGAKP